MTSSDRNLAQIGPVACDQNETKMIRTVAGRIPERDRAPNAALGRRLRRRDLSDQPTDALVRPQGQLLDRTTVIGYYS
jgi:hypothetical protein